MASVSPETKYNFSHNFLVLKDALPTLMSSEEYSIMNHRQTTKKYSEFTLVHQDAIIFGDDDHSRVYVFDAKYNSQTPRMRFIQTAKVCGTSVYLLHLAISLDRDPKNYIRLLRTFSCK